MKVYLIGHRGVGKTTAAPLAAARLGLSWLDLDAEIERHAGASVAQLFARDGESAFRDRESAALVRASQGDGLVVSTGGGVVVRPGNQEILRCGICIWLRARVDTLVARLQIDAYRPPLTNRSLLEETEHLLMQRQPIYQALAKETIDVDDFTADEVADRIAVACRRHTG